MQFSRTFSNRVVSYVIAVLLLGNALTVGTKVESRELNSGSEIAQKIAPCPQSPNCVSSLDRDPAHRVAPLHHDLAEKDALARLRSIIETMPRTKIVQSKTRYLRAEFRSAFFGFVDDLELMVGNAPGVIHIRSSSRVGYWDLGVNRRRVERIREKFVHNQNVKVE